MTTFVENPNLIFVHIPKNGGSSITSWLRTNLDGIKGTITHGGMQHIKKDFNLSSNCSTFAVVRNPWDRMVSAYEFKKRKSSLQLGFSEWLYSEPEKNNNWFTFKTPQIKWLPTMPTWILRFENLQEDFKIIQNYSKCYEPLRHKNKTIRNDYTTYYNTDTMKHIAKLFEEDIDTFKYKF